MYLFGNSPCNINYRARLLCTMITSDGVDSLAKEEGHNFRLSDLWNKKQINQPNSESRSDNPSGENNLPHRHKSVITRRSSIKQRESHDIKDHEPSDKTSSKESANGASEQRPVGVIAFDENAFFVPKKKTYISLLKLTFFSFSLSFSLHEEMRMIANAVCICFILLFICLFCFVFVRSFLLNY